MNAAASAAFNSTAPPPSMLSFVLTIALGDTGRPGSDLNRMRLLLESFDRCVTREDVAAFLIITRPQDRSEVSACVASLPAAEYVTVVEEGTICPELLGDPDTTSHFPVQNKGWVRQQVLKFGAAAHVRTPFYMTLDSDVVFVSRFRTADLLPGGRSIVNTHTIDDFTRLYTDEKARSSRGTRIARDERSRQLLGLARTRDCFYGETPVIYSAELVGRLQQRLEARHGRSWCAFLLDAEWGWTEQSLYFTLAEGAGLFDSHHISGGFDSVLRMSDSLWYASEHYRTPHSLDNWRWCDSAPKEGVAVVVQSYLGYDVAAVRAKVDELSARRGAK